MTFLKNVHNHIAVSSFDAWYANIYPPVQSLQNQDALDHSDNILNSYPRSLSSSQVFPSQTVQPASSL